MLLDPSQKRKKKRISAAANASEKEITPPKNETTNIFFLHTRRVKKKNHSFARPLLLHQNRLMSRPKSVVRTQSRPTSSWLRRLICAKVS